MPLIVNLLTERLNFPITLRAIRILSLVVRHFVPLMPSECEIGLSLLNHMLDPDAVAPWKRVLSMEVLRGLYADPRLILTLYRSFDEREGRKSLVRDTVAAFVHMVGEKPALIGLSHRSSAPSEQNSSEAQAEQTAAEAGGVAEIIGGTIGPNPANMIGISSQLSSVKTPCLDQLDKAEPPALPETYIYSLVLACVFGVSESLAKFILPLTVPPESKQRKRTKGQEISAERSDIQRPDSPFSRTPSYRKKTLPINPLLLNDHPAYQQILSVAGLINECWPGLLATCSTFLRAALDADYYHALVRSIQKFTQVAGLLKLSTPRDAFLTMLSKAAVPVNVLSGLLAASGRAAVESPKTVTGPKRLLSVETIVSQASNLTSEMGRRLSLDAGPPSLTSRNMLCLRALLNLAIALGPTLDASWAIIFETLQQTDIIMALGATKTGSRSAQQIGAQIDDDTTTLHRPATETAAVQAASSRLFESTVDFPNDCFMEVLSALCDLLHNPSSPSLQTSSTSPRLETVAHQRGVRSTSGISLNIDNRVQNHMFALGKIGELARLNVARFATYDPKESGWNLLVAELISTSTSPDMSRAPRCLAAEILSRILLETAIIVDTEESDEKYSNACRSLSALRAQVMELRNVTSSMAESASDVDIEIHAIVMDAMRAILEKCGDSISPAWDIVFEIIVSVFDGTAGGNSNLTEKLERTQTPLGGLAALISTKLGRSSFESVQLICSDFLSSLPESSISTLMDVLYRFCSQNDDLNISLTVSCSPQDSYIY